MFECGPESVKVCYKNPNSKNLFGNQSPLDLIIRKVCARTGNGIKKVCRAFPDCCVLERERELERGERERESRES